MNDLPPITERERWLYEKVLPGVWGGSWPVMLMGPIIPACITGNYWWLVLTLLVGLLLYFSGKKLSQYTFLYKARMTKADWKRLEDEIRDGDGSFFEDLASLSVVPVCIAIYWIYRVGNM